MFGFPPISPRDHLLTAVQNASNTVVSGKRAVRQDELARRLPLSENHREIEDAVNTALGEFIPDHEVYNEMRGAALEAIVKNRVFELDPIKDSEKLETVAAIIDEKQPKFRYDENDREMGLKIAALYQLVKDLPPTALGGHRWERAQLDGNETGSVEAHRSKQTVLAHELTDTLTPASAYYNDFRQKFFEIIRDRGSSVKQWANREYEIEKAARIRSELGEAKIHVSNGFIHSSKRAVEAISKFVLPYKEAFKSEIPKTKSISSEVLVRIGKLIVAHHRISEPVRGMAETGERPSKVRRLDRRPGETSVPDRVPPAIIDASKHFEKDLRPMAIKFRMRLVAQINSICPPTPRNFDERLKLVGKVFDHRETLLSASSTEEAYRSVIGRPDSPSNRATSKHQQTIRDMAEVCERFVAAYEGRDPKFGLDARGDGPSAPVRRTEMKRIQAAKSRGLAKAAADDNQLSIERFVEPLKRRRAQMESAAHRQVPQATERSEGQVAGPSSLRQSTSLDERSRNRERSPSR